MATALPRVFRMARWVKVVSAIATLLLCACGGYYMVWGPHRWYQALGAGLFLFGLAGFFDVLVSRVILEEDAIHVVSLVRRRSYPRSDFESAKVDGGYVCLKRHDGGWLILPGTGHNSLGVRNTVHAWVKAGQRDA